MRNRFGKLLKKHRMRASLGLREFCLKNQIDPSDYSRVERGMLCPQDHEIEKYAIALRLELGSDECFRLFNLAATERGQVTDIVSDGELVDKLPVLLRTVSPEKLNEFIEKIRRS